MHGEDNNAFSNLTTLDPCLTRDCTLALSTFLHDIRTARAPKLFSAAVCLDIQGGYDSVCPEILTYKLSNLGIRGKTGRWITSFTHIRRIQVFWKNLLSGTASCTRGVPQGSVFFPLLFLLYTLDIVETLDTGVRRSFMLTTLSTPLSLTRMRITLVARCLTPWPASVPGARLTN